MEKDKKLLKGYGYIFTFLAIWGVVSVFLDKTDIASAAASSGVAEGTIFWIAVGIAVVSGLIELFLGVKALKEANGTSKGTGHITLAKVIFVFYVIGFIGAIISFINKTGDILNLLTYFTSTVVLFDYIRITSKLRED